MSPAAMWTHCSNVCFAPKGMPASMADTKQIAFESALALADVWALDQLWRELGFDALAGVFRKALYTTKVEHVIRVN